MLTADRLMARYPYMFDAKHIGFEFYQGWMPILEDACAQIDSLLGDDKRGFHWRQIKEKFGSARFYYALRGSKRMVVDVHGPEVIRTLKTATKKQDPVAQRIDEIVDAAESKTQTACIVCGAQGTLQAPQGWYVTLCNAHLRKDISGAAVFR